MHSSPQDASGGPLRVGLLGLGVVGSGVHRLLQRNGALVGRRAGRAIELRSIAARNVAHAQEVAGTGVPVVGDAMAVVTDPDIDVVVEVIGGCTVARQLVMAAIAHGKHVVTANKALLALHGEEIFTAAQERGVVVAFEGAVAVSIPIVKALREGLAANEIAWLAGIVNGTSNFILTQMRQRGTSFDDALREAQRLGYAEADPAFDVDGVDSAHKLALLASLAFGTRLAFGQIEVAGIRDVQLVDLQCAERLGHRLKLIASARRHGARVALRVGPALVPADSLMARVDGSMNGIVVQGDAAGQTMYHGAGAGSLETASAVVADLVELARTARVPARDRVPPLGVRREQAVPLVGMASQEISTPHYLRLALAPGSDLDDVLGGLAAACIRVVAQVDVATRDAARGVALVTAAAPGSAVREAIGLLACGGVIEGPVACLRVESLQ
ncbi:MAG: homoserine dehydrogenase [Burkholderiaceae bacterium]